MVRLEHKKGKWISLWNFLAFVYLIILRRDDDALWVLDNWWADRITISYKESKCKYL